MGNALGLLEFNLVRERLASYTTFSPARELALELVPSTCHGEVVRLQQRTSEGRRLLEVGAAVDLSEAGDLRQVLTRVSLGGVLTGVELAETRRTLKSAREARAAVVGRREVPSLLAIARDVPVFRDLERELATSIGDSGEILDTASPVLREMRSETRTAYQRLMEFLERTMRRQERNNILQEPLITQRNGRMVLLVKTEMKHRLPGIVHDVSDSGATQFVEPMASVGLGNRWWEARLAEEREEERVLRSLSGRMEAQAQELAWGLDLLAQLDLAMAKARYSEAMAAAAPVVVESTSQHLRLVDARHPLLEAGVVPITVKLGEEWPVLLVTGPNAGGKTVALKTVGLLTLMAQAGLHLPAGEATLSLFDGIYADIGDQQSIQRSLSTFSSHIQNLRDILAAATPRSLVLIDELGSSTDPEEGTALAKAVLRHFHGRGICLMATTHHREVAAFVQEHPGMLNASVELDPATLAPTFRLTLGLPGRSYALAIASRLGLEKGVVDDARGLLAPGHQRAEGLLSELQQERRLAEEVRRNAEAVLAEAEARSSRLEEELAAVQDTKAELIDEARHQLQRRVEELSRRLRNAERPATHPAMRPPPEQWEQTQPREALHQEALKAVAQVGRELRGQEWRPPPTRRGDWLQHLKPGDRVYLRGIPKPVEVIAPPDEGGTLEVLLGTMRARLPAHQVDRPAHAKTTSTGDGVFVSRAPRQPVARELDLRGARVEEALERLGAYLSDAALAGLSSVRISHGAGTGALRAAIRECLASHSLVKSAQRDPDSRGDTSTLADLV